jgi:hypothetical protein
MKLRSQKYIDYFTSPTKIEYDAAYEKAQIYSHLFDEPEEITHDRGFTFSDEEDSDERFLRLRQAKRKEREQQG